jgi:hypothetical protein
MSKLRRAHDAKSSWLTSAIIYVQKTKSHLQAPLSPNPQRGLLSASFLTLSLSAGAFGAASAGFQERRCVLDIDGLHMRSGL